MHGKVLVCGKGSRLDGWKSLGKESRLQDFGRDITRFRSPGGQLSCFFFFFLYLQDRVRKPGFCEVLESCQQMLSRQWWATVVWALILNRSPDEGKQSSDLPIGYVLKSRTS